MGELGAPQNRDVRGSRWGIVGHAQAAARRSCTARGLALSRPGRAPEGALDRIGYQYLDGGTPGPQRQQAVAAFQSGESELFLISLRAGGFGLNLTAAEVVVHLDPWWNPAVEDQASDRAHRLGQTRPVTVYRLVAAGTIEERIVALHQRKRALADELLSGTDGGALTADALLALLREGP